LIYINTYLLPQQDPYILPLIISFKKKYFYIFLTI